MKRLPFLLSGVLTMTVASTSAFAGDDASEPVPTAPPEAKVTETTTGTVDTVHLRSGGLYRGRVLEIVPGSHVLVMVPSGDSHKVSWAEVDRVIVATTSIPALPARSGPSPAAAPAAVAPKVGPMVRVHLKAPGAYLYRRPIGGTEFVTACEYPCDEPMPLGDTYKVGGAGMKTSKEFQLHGVQGDTIEVDADGPSWLGIVAGGSLVTVGAVGAYIGTLVALAGTSCNCDGLGLAGLATMGLSAGAIALGLAVIYPSLKTDIEQERVTPGRDAFVRPPTWRTASAHEGSAPGTSFPLVFTHHF